MLESFTALVTMIATSFETVLHSFVDVLESVTANVSVFNSYITPFGMILNSVYTAIPTIYTSGFLIFLILVIVFIFVKEYF